MSDVLDNIYLPNFEKRKIRESEPYQLLKENNIDPSSLEGYYDTEAKKHATPIEFTELNSINDKEEWLSKHVNKEVYKEYTSFDEITDEDGYPTENLNALQNWLKSVFDRILKEKEYNVLAINFSTYGASFVHLDENGEVLTPLYNYTKPLDETLTASFLEKYGPKDSFLKTIGCYDLSMLNSGMQLYWLKQTKPEIFKKSGVI